jgi:hypothetical protein
MPWCCCHWALEVTSTVMKNSLQRRVGVPCCTQRWRSRKEKGTTSWCGARFAPACRKMRLLAPLWAEHARALLTLCRRWRAAILGLPATGLTAVGSAVPAASPREPRACGSPAELLDLCWCGHSKEGGSFTLQAHQHYLTPRVVCQYTEARPLRLLRRLVLCNLSISKLDMSQKGLRFIESQDRRFRPAWPGPPKSGCSRWGCAHAVCRRLRAGASGLAWRCKCGASRSVLACRAAGCGWTRCDRQGAKQLVGRWPPEPCALAAAACSAP